MYQQNITTIPQLNNLIISTYFLAFIVTFAMLTLAFLICNLIPWHGGSHDRSFITRRWIYGIIGILGFILFFIYNYFFVVQKMKNVVFQSRFMLSNIICSVIILLLYLLLGLGLMKIMRKSKFGSILG